MSLLRILTVFGTRPETIKCAPVLQALNEDEQIESLVCVTGQHKEMLHQMLKQFHITPTIDLALMRDKQSLHRITADILAKMDGIIRECRPDRIIVQGDTTTAFATGLAGFYAGIPVTHIEAGLRSHNIHSPFPEEFNRKALSMAADMHCAPTESARELLREEHIPDEQIIVTGNTVVDALMMMQRRLTKDPILRSTMEQAFSFLDAEKKLILVTMHRRENMGHGMQSICYALRQLAMREDAEIIVPVHLNPHVKNMVESMLGKHPNIHLVDPLDYHSFIYLLDRATIAISDSGGIQEEAPSLATPLLVTRDTTERPEGIKAGAVRLVGADTKRIVRRATFLLDDEAHYASMQSAQHLYGDGQASRRIVEAIKQRHGLSDEANLADSFQSYA